MVKRRLVELIDDTDGTTAETTISFALDGAQYELDLSAKNADKLRRDFARWTEHARRVSGRRATTTKRSTPATADSVAIRDWANANGLKVAARGRISAEVREAYSAAH